MPHFNIKRSRLEQKKILDYKCYKSTYNHKGQIQKKCHVKLQNNKKQTEYSAKKF